MTDIDDYRAGFLEEPGYLDYGRVGPISRAVQGELHATADIFARARFGSLASLAHEDERVRAAASALTGFPADRIAFQPSTSQALMQVMFGLTGKVLLSPAEFPALPFAAQRAAEALHVLEPVWLGTAHGKVTPSELREQLTDDVVAVAVSLVDSRTGYVADLDGIRQVIGDRLLIVDAIQGFGVVDAPWEVVDVLATGGQKWVRAGWGTGFLALSERALGALTPVFSGWVGTDVAEPYDMLVPPAHAARAFTVSHPDRVAQACLAAALEEIAAVGVPAINAAVAEGVARVLELCDEFSIYVASSRAVNERAGIVVLEPEPEALTRLTASLFNHGITATTRGGAVRLSVHAATSEETLGMLRGAFTSYGSAY
ncbi:aminotransferase class V-fold PLP-dependent enzyme [Gryllotalpicola ginsengisoli]|uniref:aminotransferase class V-fold PLP-dependent enzyme n=1 Tax=Gryllotalpicola ginsengisoli TaxID=444608 RepID=UPI0003B3CE70|nr:aminotransferase class V-fold PLP-dependent enzyme [Gryllotalpicola ginsengisoli]